MLLSLSFLLSSVVARDPCTASIALVAAGDSKPEEILITNDPKKRYFLHAPPAESKEADSGWRVLVVLPGGDGSAEFAPFVGRIREKALGEGWLIAQMVAPVWDEQQAESLVWPTEKHSCKAMKFSTEKFFNAVLDDLGQRRHIDPSSIFTLSWSSGGPAAYALSLEPKTRIAGSFIAMSVFYADWLPPLKTSAGRSYYLYNSKQDTIVDFHLSEQARDALKKHGAVVTLKTYDGGHGWHGDVFSDIKRGMTWLEEKTVKPAKAKPAK